MIRTIALLAALFQAQGSETPAPPSAGLLISGMLAHYSGAKSMVGKIRLTLTLAGESTSVDTIVQFEKPSLVYIGQIDHTRPPKTWVVVSDGRHFSYPAPPDLPMPPDDHLLEAVDQYGVIQTCQDIYGAAVTSIADRSMPLDIAFSRLIDLKSRRDQWATHQRLGQDQINGQAVTVVGGDWRATSLTPVSGTYKMWLTDSGDLLRYEEDASLMIPDPARPQKMMTSRLKSVWDVDLKVDGEPDKSLFQLNLGK